MADTPTKIVEKDHEDQNLNAASSDGHLDEQAFMTKKEVVSRTFVQRQFPGFPLSCDY